MADNLNLSLANKYKSKILAEATLLHDREDDSE
jgi:hypothetical protein